MLYADGNKLGFGKKGNEWILYSWHYMTSTVYDMIDQMIPSRDAIDLPRKLILRVPATSVGNWLSDDAYYSTEYLAFHSHDSLGKGGDFR